MVTVNDFHHASYYPGAKPLALTVLWDKATDVLLGAQAAGQEGVDKRLDVMSTAIAAQMTIDDLVHLELAYAPPFGSAKDIINIAGFAATNERDGLVDTVSELPDDPDVQIVDVRGKAMADANPVAGAVNIPMPILRNNLDRLDRSKPVVTVCALGKNSYFASRVLKENGFDVKSLEGGIKMMVRRNDSSSKNPNKKARPDQAGLFGLPDQALPDLTVAIRALIGMFELSRPGVWPCRSNSRLTPGRKNRQ